MDRRTCVDKVVGVVVVANGTRLCLVELGVFYFFELDHGFGAFGGCRCLLSSFSLRGLRGFDWRGEKGRGGKGRYEIGRLDIFGRIYFRN